MSRLARRGLLGLGTLLLIRPARASGPVMELWKNRGCACCIAWARHFEAAGFTVTTHEVDDLAPARAAAGVPRDLAGCHTARVAGYIIEGHVPLADVQRLLVERPRVLGLAVAGMPMGSPGMEMPGIPAERFDVLAFTADGSRSVYRTVLPG